MCFFDSVLIRGKCLCLCLFLFPRITAWMCSIRALGVIESEISHRDWQIFQKIFLNNHSPEEVAGEFKCSKRVVYIVQSRILSKLRVIVAKFIENAI